MLPTTNPSANGQGKDKEEQLEATQRTCQVSISNQFGSELRNISLRHRMHNETSGEEFVKVTSLKNDGASSYQTIHYMTGIGSGYDYWYVQFEDAHEGTYHCKDNFYCNLTKDDADQNIIVTLLKSEMSLTMPSNGCKVSLTKN